MDAISLAVFQHLFSSIAEEMGVTLQRTGFSPNIKERRDYSCALFDHRGQMIAQAAHIPVHLGAMPLSTQAAMEDISMRPGDVVIVNDPFRGGTHLPDITLVAPVFFPGEASPRFYVANRAHHADVGGTRPGSMPLSTHIDEEGLRLAPTLLLRGGVREASTWEKILGAVRTPEEREGDLAAQLAACHVGAARLHDAARRYPPARLTEAGEALCDYAERVTRHALRALPPGDYRFEDRLDDDGAGATDIPLRVVVTAHPEGAVTIDFSESAPELRGCLNAVEAITLSACHYVLRTLVDVDIPANSGVARAITLVAPRGSVVNACPPAAVAGGNVETSQRLVDVLLGAFAQALPDRIPAASAGTMNNLALGGVTPEGRPFAYYETIAGGAGAGPGWEGADAVQTHMTNTLNTPIEALEHAYPLRVRRYALRRQSGGPGAWRGGDGVVRAIEFLCPSAVTLLSERRTHAPWGLAGGQPGARGQNWLWQRGSSTPWTPEAPGAPLPGKVERDVQAGDILTLCTPGGGGFGPAST